MKFLRFHCASVILLSLIAGGCATDIMTKADLVRAFDACGIKEEYILSSTGRCNRLLAGSLQPCDMTYLDPMTRSTLLESGKASRTFLDFGTVLPIKTKDGEEAAVAIDKNTILILYSRDNHEKMYLAESSWLTGDFIYGLRSRILGWGKVMKISDIDNVELYTEFTRKRPKSESCLQDR